MFWLRQSFGTCSTALVLRNSFSDPNLFRIAVSSTFKSALEYSETAPTLKLCIEKCTLHAF